VTTRHETGPSPLPRWTTISAHPLRWHTWGDGHYVVYHTGSGDTHMLNEVAAEVLRQLDGRTIAIPDLTARVALAIEVDSAELAPHIERIVPYLEDLGLIEPAA